jgi:PKD repeat protein
MTRKWSNFTRNISMIIALVNCAAVVSANAQTIWIPPRPTIAFTASQWGWGAPCVGDGVGCNGGGTLQPIGSVVVTPFGHSWGTWDSEPTWSPDATRIAYVSSGDIVLADAAGNAYANITATASYELSPAWSPDGRRLAFVSDRDGQHAVYVMNLDGTNVVRLAPQLGDSPTWSPDSTRVAFACVVETSNRDICVVNSDGTGFRRLTDDPAWDVDPAWSLEGGKIAFQTGRYGGQHLALMNTDGSGVSQLGGVQGSEPAWSSDGRYIAATSSPSGIFAMKADGSDGWDVIYGDYALLSSPSWMPGSLFARFNTNCTALVCSFDASTSVGAITNYTWSFGDTLTGSGSVVRHTFAEGGSYTISLAVTDGNGATATEELILTLNRPPVASFAASCSGLQCTFDGRASSDSDGKIVYYNWKFGDGFGGDGPAMVAHLYRAVGTYEVVLTVTDDSGATDAHSATVTLRGVHIGDLVGASNPNRNSWTASVTLMVHDDAHNSVANATVTGSWSGVSGAPTSCKTADSGVCTITSDVPNSIGSITFNVLSVVAGTAFYDAARNHDVDGGTNGTTVTVRRH